MPIYVYRCEKCQNEVELMQKLNDPAPEKCEACGEGGAMARQMSRTSFVLKGGGWYNDLYSSAKKDSPAKEGSKESTTASTPAPAAAATPSTTPASTSTGSTASTTASPAPSSGSGSSSSGSGKSS